MLFDMQTYEESWDHCQQKQIIPQSDYASAYPTDRSLAPIPLAVYATIPSTNQQLWTLIDTGQTIPCGAIALEQTAGKGQWGRTWLSSKGGLYLSVAIPVDLPLTNHPHLIMATAWGIASMLRSYDLPVSLKWLNDLILEQRKLGGIKIETRTKGAKITQAVIGVGINWRNPVPEVGINLQSYNRQAPETNISSLERLAAITAYGILAGYEYYLAVGIERLLDRYLAILSNLGQQIAIDGCLGEVTGVTTQGELKVRWRSRSARRQSQSPGATTEICFAPGQISLGYYKYHYQ